MSLDKIYGIAGTALNAQLTRMNLTASNLANQGTVNTTESEAFRAKRPVFKAILSHEMATPGAPYVGGVKVDRIVDTSEALETKVFQTIDRRFRRERATLGILSKTSETLAIEKG